MLNERKERKYYKIGFCIEVSLHCRDYIVRANILKQHKESNDYQVTLELRRHDIGKWDMLDEKHYHITADNINMAVYDLIMDKFKNGFFARFIDRYEYELCCFDRGNDLFEMERYRRSSGGVKIDQ